jgi:CheY-like chemotaxis protein
MPSSTQVLAVIATAKNADEAIRIASLRHPDVVLLDVRMPNGGGPRAAREISWRSPTLASSPSPHDDPRSVDDMLASGATSYLVKDSSLEEIVEAVTRSIDGGASLADSVTEHVASELGSRLALERGLATERRDKRERIRWVIRGTSLMNIVYQPIVERTSGTVVGLEALARFPDESVRPPDEWFDEAAEVGLGARLQARRFDRRSERSAGYRPMSS